MGDDALHFRFASMVGSNGSFFRVGALTRGGEKFPVADGVHAGARRRRLRVLSAAEVRYELEDGRTTASASRPSAG